MQLQDELLIIAVEDDGQGIGPEQLEQIRQGLERRIDWMKSSIGLANVHQRIRTIYGPAYGLSIDSGPDGTVVLLRFPARAAGQESSPEGGHAERGNAS